MAMFRWYDCLEGHVLLGFVFSITSIVLFITFLHTPSVDFGAFGYCTPRPEGGETCTKSAVGYDYPGGEVIAWLTKAAILFPIAALFNLFALTSLILFLRRARSGTHAAWYRTFAILAILFVVPGEIFALVLWVNARRRFQSHDQDQNRGMEVKYGAALWLGLAATITCFLRYATLPPRTR